MIRGTRIIEASSFNGVIDVCRNLSVNAGFIELIIPSIWEQQTFIDKAGPEIIGQMYAFEDKKGRPICLIPEVTAIIQEQWRRGWSKEKPKPYRVSYLSRCYRYERPQAGRYREFWQWGCELLGDGDTDEVVCLLRSILDTLDINYTFEPAVKRGLDYYIEDGFEAVCETLGAQKQIAGGGRYEGGVGFAIGIDRIIEARETVIVPFDEA